MQLGKSMRFLLSYQCLALWACLGRTPCCSLSMGRDVRQPPSIAPIEWNLVKHWTFPSSGSHWFAAYKCAQSGHRWCCVEIMNFRPICSALKLRLWVRSGSMLGLMTRTCVILRVQLGMRVCIKKTRNRIRSFIWCNCFDFTFKIANVVRRRSALIAANFYISRAI